MATARVRSDARPNTEKFRELVQLYLGTHGIAVRRRPWVGEAALDSKGNPEGTELGDLRGIDDVVLLARHHREMNFSGGLDRVGAAMRADGKALGWLLHYRVSRDTGDMYALCTLDTLARVLQKLERLNELEKRAAA